MGRGNTLPTIWEIPDDLWEQIHPVILQMEPPKFTGRKRVHPRQILDGIIFRMRTGSHWTRLPRELGDDSTIHRTFQRWVELGVLERIWAVLIEECEELGALDWEWQSADCAMGKARFGGFSWCQPHG
jgi:putative transposase